MLVHRFTLAVVLVVSLAVPAVAQTVSLNGTVTDAQGAVVRDAQVELIDQQGNTTRTNSGPDGVFAFAGLAPGRYVVNVASPGFSRWSRDVAVGATPPSITIRLEVAGFVEDVTVAGAAPSTLSVPAPTGSRLGLTPLETPATVQVISAEAIQERGDVSVTDATIRAAGVTTAPSASGGMGGISYRGFTGVDSVVQLYDGMQLWVAQGTVTFPFDAAMADRIEILAGPSSVLYGTGAIGGAVNVVPRKPNRGDLTNDVRLAAGSDNTYRGVFGSGGPLGSRVSYRFDVSGLRTDGWVDRGDADSTAVSGAVRFDATPAWHLTVSHDYGLQRPAYDTGVPLINGRLDESRARRNYNVADAALTMRDRWTQVRSEWTPAQNVVVRNNAYAMTSFRHYYGLLGYVFDPSRQQIRRTTGSDVFHNQRQYGFHTDALVRSSLLGRENAFSAGVDYDHGTFRWINNAPYTWVSFVDLDNSQPGVMVNLDGTSPKFRSISDRVSGYIEDRLAVSSRLSVVGGLRVEHSVLDRVEIQTNTPSEHAFTPMTGRGGVVFNVARDTALYGQFSTANDSIGNLLTLTPQQQRLELTTGRQVEAGVKQSVANGRAEWTAALFRIVKENLVTSDPSNPAVQIQIGQQSSQGIEATGRASLGRGVRAEANGTWLRARYDDFTELVAGRPVSRVGNRPTNVPRAAANLWLTWDANSRLQARGGVRIVGRRFGDTANTFVVPSYSVVDGGLRLGLTSRTALNLRVYNALDRIFVVAPRGNLSNPQWLLGRPRGFDVEWSARF
jgi:iron complex outermembrane recepter protein